MLDEVIGENLGKAIAGRWHTQRSLVMKLVGNRLGPMTLNPDQRPSVD